jgi:hypothetical protein
MTILPRLVLASVTTIVLACTPPLPALGQDDHGKIVLFWTRQGGLAGFCDELKVTGSGDVTATSCATGAAQKTRKLSPDEQSQLERLRQTFASVTFSSTDAAAADAMKQTVTFSGKGRIQPSETQQRELLDWAQRVYSTTGR